MDKIAIQVPNKYLSEAVQRCLFDKGYRWCGDKEAEVRATKEKILYIEGTTIWCGVFAADTYTYLTVDEFFKREVTVKIRCGGQSHRITEGKFGFEYGFVIEGLGYMSWKDFDKIGTLRQKEKENG